MSAVAGGRQPLNIVPVPLDLAWQDPAENLRRMRKAIEDVLKRHTGFRRDEVLFVFPELCLTGFVTENPYETALTRDSQGVKGAQALARELGVGMVVGFPERTTRAGAPAVQNTLLVIDPRGEILVDYQKINLFTQGKTPESATYAAGTEPRVLDYRGWRLGFGICFDIRFPELFIEYRKRGCDAMIVPACWVGGPTKSDQFQTLARAHAILTQSFVFAVNRIGADPYFKYEGEALAYGPRGEALWVQLEKTAPVALGPDYLDEARKMRLRAEFGS